MLNDISRICPLLKKYGIMTVVDSVSAMFGEYTLRVLQSKEIYLVAFLIRDLMTTTMVTIITI